MKDDTNDFTLLFCSEYFNFCSANNDPFLIQTSMLPKKNLAAGGGLRTLQNRAKEDSKKLVLPLDNTLVHKAKAC